MRFCGSVRVERDREVRGLDEAGNARVGTARTLKELAYLIHRPLLSIRTD